MLDGDRLDQRPHLHRFLGRRTVLQMPIKAGAADLRQLTHTLDTETALHRHHFFDLVVDAFAPDSPLRWRRASTLCKAPLKKSTSRVLSTSTRWSWCTIRRSVAWGELPVAGSAVSSKGANWSRHLYSRRRCTPSSFDNATMLSQVFNRSTAFRRNAFEYRPTRCFPTCRSFPCTVCLNELSQFWGSLQEPTPMCAY